MAKILCNYFGLSMAAEGKSEFVGRQAAAFLDYVQQDAERCAENCGCAEDLSDAPEKIKREILRNDEELRRREQTAPGVEHRSRRHTTQYPRVGLGRPPCFAVPALRSGRRTAGGHRRQTGPQGGTADKRPCFRCSCVAPFRFVFCVGSIIPRNAPAVNRGGAAFCVLGLLSGAQFTGQAPGGRRIRHFVLAGAAMLCCGATSGNRWI